MLGSILVCRRCGFKAPLLTSVCSSPGFAFTPMKVSLHTQYINVNGAETLE